VNLTDSAKRIVSQKHLKIIFFKASQHSALPHLAQHLNESGHSAFRQSVLVY
jgi:hypothetical protein